MSNLRLVYMLQHDPPLVKLKTVEWLIIDEADKLFEVDKFDNFLLLIRLSRFSLLEG